ncbi:hypothetical protein LPC08_25295 (plasmid) [Roseomonas sp. OT10]|uniref:8-oxoguanine DNA glycosylase OGG fold protein n=1 Tax=Roseomonas cutis TaxID=2897332 RepID=UPI001E61ED3D|nr:hypothetical protein [Roseomonas sp. OT10]UFN51582.1 hypothetical protein LPC08_25295 [Roseomonas sp. OT10]
MDLEPRHLDALRKARRAYDRAAEERGTRTGLEWVTSLGLGERDGLPGIERHRSEPNREDLFSLVADASQDTMTLCAVILAWGGMRVSHGKALFGAGAGAVWRRAAEEVRFEDLGRADAYSRFHALRLRKVLPGMGPAYFTKLVFFLRGKDVHDVGYIMDQWTGCSLNVLTGDPNTVLMNATYTWKRSKKTRQVGLRSAFQVSDENGPDRYERFCSAVDRIAGEVSLSRMDAELLLMSRGRGRGAWRKHVLHHRQTPTIGPA